MEEGPEKPDGVTAAADASNEEIGEASFFFEDLPSGFFSDDAVKISDDHGIGMRSESGSEDIMRGAYVGDPVSHGLINGLFERGLTCSDGDDFCTKEAHSGDIEGLAFHIDGPHVDDAF